jgi:hypothetical protein
MLKMFAKCKCLTEEGVFCHNPTINPKQPKTTFVGIVLLSVKKPPHHHHPGFHYNLGSFRQPKNMIFGMQPYFNPTR